MRIIEVTDHDILADVLRNGRYSLEAYKKHIGNSRFIVLLDMYRDAYDMNYMRTNDDECEKIVERIIQIASHEGVNVAVQGRFLAKDNGGAWLILEDEPCKQLVHQAFRTPTSITEEPLDAEEIPSNGFGLMALGIDTPPTESNDKKRGRRRSLLRRSNSESTMLDDKKKMQFRELIGFDLPNPPSHQSDLRRHQSESVTAQPTTQQPAAPGPLERQRSAPVIRNSTFQIREWKGMDVVMSADGLSLSANEAIIGNNRLQVMLSLQRGNFKALSPDQQEKVAADLVKAVCQYWGGRVLLDQGFEYSELPKEDALQAMKNLLLPEEGIPLAASESGKPLLSAPPVPDFLRKASLDMLGNDGETEDSYSMQSQAVKSLQDRKAKRAMTKSLGRGQSVPETFATL